MKISYEELKTLLERKSLGEIAKELNVSKTTVLKWTKEYGLKSRFPKKKPLHCQITPKLLEFLDGLLLPGGSIVKLKTSAKFTVTSKSKEFLEWISHQLQDLGLSQLGKISPMQIKANNYLGWRYSSYAYVELLEVYHRWYQNGKKRVPFDFSFTPLIMLLWYLRSGYIEKDSSRKKTPYCRIKFSVETFPLSDRKYLIDRFFDVGIRAKLYDTKIVIPLRDFGTFFSYIGPCPKEIEKVFGHKWPEASG